MMPKTRKHYGTLVRKEGQSSNGDVAADEAGNYLGVTHDFFWQIYKRNSLDNHGLKLAGTVHYGEKYQNAFWNGQQMVFGDGDGEIFNRFTIAIDVVAHELSHGVTETEAGLIYFEQAGALNESMSDVFGSLVKQFSLKQTADKADWIIGEGLLAKGINGKGLRSMSHPGTAYDDPMLGKDPQPGHMKDYIKTREDNGGVHLNSGIPNRAFYLAAKALADMPGSERVRHGTTRCAIKIYIRMRTSKPLHNSPCSMVKSASTPRWRAQLNKRGKR